MFDGGERGFNPEILSSAQKFEKKLNREIDENKLADEINLSIAEETGNPFHGMEGSEGYVEPLIAEPAGEDENDIEISMTAEPANDNDSEDVGVGEADAA